MSKYLLITVSVCLTFSGCSEQPRTVVTTTNTTTQESTADVTANDTLSEQPTAIPVSDPSSPLAPQASFFQNSFEESTTEPSGQQPSGSIPLSPLAAAQPPNPTSADSSPTPTDQRSNSKLLERAKNHSKAGNHDEAIRLAKQALTQATADPATWNALAEILARAKRLNEAVATLEDATLKQHANKKTRLLLVQSYRLQAKRSNNTEIQSAAIARAAEIMRQIQKNGELEELGQHGIQLYLTTLIAEARLAALLNKQQRSLTALQEIFETGFSRTSDLVNDRAFDLVRDSPEFTSLVERYRKKHYRQLQAMARRTMATTQPFPFDFSLNDYRGEQFRLSDFKGKVILIDFWGTWCGPCRMETPHLVKLQNQYPDDLAIVGLTYEKATASQARKLIKDFVDFHNIPFPCLLGDKKTMRQVPDFRAFPTLLFLDRTGKVRLRMIGYHGYEKLQAVISLLIDEPRKGSPVTPDGPATQLRLPQVGND